MVVKYALSVIPYTLDDVKLGSLLPCIRYPNKDALVHVTKLRMGLDFRWRNQKNFDTLFKEEENK